MTTITISNTAGDQDLSVLEIDFQGFLNKTYKRFEYEADGHGVQTATLYQKGGDFLQMVGSFNLSGLKNKDRVEAVEQIDSLSIGNGDQVTYTLDNLDLTKADLKNDTTLAAFADAQTYKILGNNSENVLAGGLLGDQLFGNGGNDELYGGAGNDKLDGGAGNDKLDGGAGKNVLTGGAGDDTYNIGANDTIVEGKGTAGGFDTVVSSAKVDLTKFANVEALTLTGKFNLNGTGNDLNNTLTGNDGANVLNGGKGADRMIGGLGNDTYYVDNAKDVIVETGKKDHDTIDATVNINLSKLSAIEDVFLLGKADLSATGNAAANHLTGNSGDNWLWGAGGNDELTGGAGVDTFHFAKGDKSDSITDFDAKGSDHDLIDLSDFGKKLKFSSIDIETVSKTDVDINFGKGDVLHIHFDHSAAKDLDASDFQF